VVAIGEVLSVVATVLDHHGADGDELLERAIDGVPRLVQPAREECPSRHALSRALAEAQQHRVQPVGTVADLGVDDPLRDDREVLFEDQGALVLEAVEGL
jgi:hypothetical protein